MSIGEAFARAALVVYLLLALFLLLVPPAPAAEPAWWVWIKHANSVEWVAFAPADSYSDCVERMLPLAARLVDDYGHSPWEPKFKCEVKS